MFNIIDEENKIIHTGTEAEMQRAWLIMTSDEKYLHRIYQDNKLKEYKEKYRVPGIVGKINMVPA